MEIQPILDDTDRKYKVLHIAPQGYTGMAYYDYSLCQSLWEQGIDSELITSDQWLLNYKENSFKIVPIYRNCSGDKSMIIKGFNYLLSTIRVLSYIILSKAKIAHFSISELPYVDLALMAAVKALGKKVCYTPHDVVSHKNYPLVKLFHGGFYKLSDRIIVHNQANLEKLETRFGVNPSKARVIPHGGYEYFVEEGLEQSYARRKIGVDPKARILLFFGNIRPGKGLDLLIQAIPYIIEKIKDLKVLIIGRISKELKKEWLQEQIETYGVHDVVTLRSEFIPDEEVELYYTASDVVVLPYTEISDSGVLRFAQTCGNVIVCSDLEEFHHSVKHGETGYIFKTGDAADMAEKIITAFMEGKDRKVGEMAQKFVEAQFNWKDIARKTKQVYSELL